MNSILPLMIGRLMHADPDTGGGTAEPASQPADMDATLNALMDKMEAGGDVETTEDPDAGAPAADEPTDKPARARDASGKFAPKAVDGGETAPSTKDPAAAVVAKPEETPAPVETKFADAPKSWNATERAAWAAIPEAARAAAHRREENFFQGIEQYKGKAATFDALDAVIRPHAKMFEMAGQNAVENIGGLLNLQQTLYTGSDEQKIATLLQVASNVGIKPEVLLQGLQNPPQPPAQDPRYDTLAKRLEQAEARLGEAALKPVQTEIERVFGDPKNEYLAEPGIQDSMLSLITSGIAKNAQDAYDKACLLSDTVKAKVSAKSAEAERKAQAERDAAEAKRKADLAANAKRASSLNVKPTGVTAGPATKGTMDDTIAAAWDRLHANR